MVLYDDDIFSVINIALLEEVVTYKSSLCVDLHAYWLHGVHIHAVPATPTFDVCAVYDTSNRALQVVERNI